MNPLNLTGPQFMVFYFVLAVLLLPAAYVLRWWLRIPARDVGAEASELSPYEVTYLNGAESGTFDAAIARLVQRDVLTASATNRTLTRSTGPYPKRPSAVEQAIQEAVGDAESGIDVATVRKQVVSAMKPLKRQLQELGLVVNDGDAWLARLLPLLLFMCVPLLGVIKIGVGISRGRPVEFLMIACVATVGIGLGVLGRKIHRSRRGDQVLARLKSENAALSISAARDSNQLTSNDLLLAVGLFGVNILAGGPLSNLVHALRPPPQASSSGSSCGSSCGGGGCGGGCGGGGCGGCGS